MPPDEIPPAPILTPEWADRLARDIERLTPFRAAVYQTPPRAGGGPCVIVSQRGRVYHCTITSEALRAMQILSIVAEALEREEARRGN